MAEKKWNVDKQQWEVDGVPVTYRVTWKTFEPPGEEHSRDFTDVDQGYDFYQDMQKSPRAYGATWDHIPF